MQDVPKNAVWASHFKILNGLLSFQNNTTGSCIIIFYIRHVSFYWYLLGVLKCFVTEWLPAPSPLSNDRRPGRSDLCI